MTGTLDVLILPPTPVEAVYVARREEMVVLGTHTDNSGMPLVDLGIDVTRIDPNFKPRKPRQNTYVPNIIDIGVYGGQVCLKHNWTDMQSQFNLREPLPEDRGGF